MKRQGLIVTINQLDDIIQELYNEFEWDGACKVTDDDRKFQINIINKTPECSDTWEIDNQRKKDKDDGSECSLSVTTKQSLRKNNKDEHMSKNVDMNVDADNLTKTSNEASRIDGCRKPQECSGQANVADKEDTNNSVLPADSNLSKADKQMLKNFEIAGEIVLLEDKELLEELSKK